MTPEAITEIEIRHLVEAIQERYGYDFRRYAKATLRRQLARRAERRGLPNISSLLPLVLHDTDEFDALLGDLSITVTQMFRDPSFYREFRRHVVPELRRCPRIKVWSAGCATGEEVYSVAIVLEEEGLLERSRIYATDFNVAALQVAGDAIYSAEALDGWERGYRDAGGRRALRDYCVFQYGAGRLARRLRERITFAFHNLTVDRSFGEMHVILCRNVMIYFERDLQHQVFSLFDESLGPGGFICLGTSEAVPPSAVARRYQRFPGTQVYRRDVAVDGAAGAA